jgi:hypothetical protein
MKWLVVVIALYFGTMQTIASQKAIDIVGSWKVVSIHMTQTPIGEEVRQFENLKTAFQNAVFSFRSDHSFTFQINLESLKVPRGVWAWDADNDSFAITASDKQPAENLMQISVLRAHGKMYFHVEETPLNLEVHLQK